MKKKTYVLGVAVLLAGLLAFSGVANSAMWVGAQLGGNFQPSTTVTGSAFGYSASTDANIKPSVIGGADPWLRFRQFRLWGLCLAGLDEIFQFCHGSYLQPAGH